MENTYEKFERKLTYFCYNFAREVEQEINSCECDREHGAIRAAEINSCLADIAGMMTNWPYALSVLDTAKSKAVAKYKHLKEVYKD